MVDVVLSWGFCGFSLKRYGVRKCNAVCGVGIYNSTVHTANSPNFAGVRNRQESQERESGWVDEWMSG
ncbi:predicted protein [Sclerotinia sclerotiorum 1980 UF-70]|uniref:Uncharacterized protein n=1 Tax=Sclerotinia sclerotiorum (strain ATCC 18683 / 1980 / Ss-1) TaxID=665079 RepID=A7F1A4_SCLS1|nr:predicted protein [Sclerotinia sclerotiorum 1980 UF-70]EDN95496.1 predicted protein [Sclerotinia sclerotiorum 1980 UF-70]